MVTKRVKDIHKQKIILISIVAPKMKSQKCKCNKDVCLESTCFLCKMVFLLNHGGKVRYRPNCEIKHH